VWCRLVGFRELYTGISFCATALTSSAFIVNKKTESGDCECHIFTIGTCTWGELGTGKAIDNFSTLFSNVLPGKAISFTAGTHHYVVVLEDGSVYGWGKTRGGQLGSSHQIPLLTPTKLDIPLDLEVAHVVCGNDFTFLYDSPQEGRYLLLGKDKHGIAAGLPSSIAQWKCVCATWHAVFILFYDGRLIAAGKQNQWKLVPDNLPPLVEIATGNEHVLTRTEDGRVLAWGWGDDGNCGDLSKMEPPTTGNFVSGRWNEIAGIPGDICLLGAGANTSFVATWVDEGGALKPKARVELAFEDQPPQPIDPSDQKTVRVVRKIP
jgi:protein ATS1